MQFKSYDSTEEMLADMRKAEEEANATLMPCQIDIRDTVDEPRYWMRLWEDILIWGEAFSREGQAESERKAGATKAEIKESTAAFDDARKRGYLYGKAYSVLEPDGEYGSTHVAQVVPIPKSLFDMARDFGWVLRDDNPEHVAFRMVLAQLTLVQMQGEVMPPEVRRK